MDYNVLIAGFINTVLVLAGVQFLKIKIPIIKNKTPWLFPIIAGAIGPAIAAGQNALMGLLGVPIDLAPILAVFTGATATAAHQVHRQATNAAAIIFLCFALAVSFSGCATIGRVIQPEGQIEKQWQQATEEEKVRLVLKDLQSSLDLSLDIGVLYVAAHPEKKEEWKSLVLPLFKKANDVLGEIIKEAKTTQGKITLSGALLKMQPHLMEIEKILLEWGMKK